MIESQMTPYYSVDYGKFRQNCAAVQDAFEKRWRRVLCGYSVKTNHDNSLICYAARKLHWLVETVSSEEYNQALGLGIPPKDLILNGPCKGEKLSFALQQGSYVNLDSLDEVRAVCARLQEGIKCEQARLGLRVNFNLEKLCPGETTAGEEVSRFGICCENGDFAEAVHLLRNAGIETAGLHMHTSTKTRSGKVFEELAKQVVRLVREHNLRLSFVDMGGGFFGGQTVIGKPTMEEYAARITDSLKAEPALADAVLLLEPGASVLATAVSYETSVLSVRDVRGVQVVTLDGTLLHINPFLADRNQPFIVRLDETKLHSRPVVKQQLLCGCTCMENDRFARLLDVPSLMEGDVLSFRNAGAYTMAMNSHFIVNPPAVRYENG